jgi:hypothetical protein
MSGIDGLTWIELREPGCVPERKGPLRPETVAGFLREVFAVRPSAYVTVITMGHDGPLLQDGPECLQMLDGRSMSVGRRHIQTGAAAHAPAERVMTLIQSAIALAPEAGLYLAVKVSPAPTLQGKQE